MFKHAPLDMASSPNCTLEEQRRNATVKETCDRRILKDYNIAVLVLSAPKNFPQRLAMRYFFKIPNAKTELIFLLGNVGDDDEMQQFLQEEHAIYGDILQMSVRDSYKNLTYKTVGGFDYIWYQRKDINLIIKLDDDLRWDEYSLR